MGGIQSKPPFHGVIDAELLAKPADVDTEEIDVTKSTDVDGIKSEELDVSRPVTLYESAPDDVAAGDVSTKFVTTLPSVKEHDDGHSDNDPPDVTCPVCDMPHPQWFLMSCYHVVCFACFEQMRTMYGHYLICPVCRTEFEYNKTHDPVPSCPFADIDLPLSASFPFVMIQCEREMLLTAYCTMHELGAWEQWHALSAPPKHHRADIFPFVEILRASDPRYESTVSLDYVLLQMYFIAKYGYRAYERHVRVFDVT